MLKTDVRGNAKSSTTTSGCETKDKGPLLVGYARQKMKACDGERLKMKALLWNNPRVPYLVETMS